MTPAEYEHLTKPCAELSHKYTKNDLVNQTPRLLLYGFTLNRETVGVVLLEDGIVLWKDLRSGAIFKHEEDGLSRDELIPSKRLYPERCDFEFCSLLAKHEVYLPFTTYDEARAAYADKIFQEIRDAYQEHLTLRRTLRL